MSLFGFGRSGHEQVVHDLHKVWATYKDIVSKQHYLRGELEKLYALEKRETELKAHLHRLQTTNDLRIAAQEATRILQEEIHFLALIEHHADHSMRSLRDQKWLITKIRRQLEKAR